MNRSAFEFMQRVYKLPDGFNVEYLRADTNTEAFVFTWKARPRTELVAQFEGDIRGWKLCLVTPKNWIVLGTGFNTENAYRLGVYLARKILANKNPANLARSYGRGNGMRPYTGKDITL